MRLFLSSAQWFMFLLSFGIVAPISIGFAFDMSQLEVAGLIQRTLFVIGISSLLQISFGHKLPIAEGPAGMWWAVLLILASVTASLETDSKYILQSVQLGLIISGVLFILVSIFKLVDVVKQIFTPMVTGTFLILLVIQLSGPFVKGILGIGYLSSDINLKVAGLGILILLVSIILAKSGIIWLKNYYVLLALAFGWIIFSSLGLVKPIKTDNIQLIFFPELFAWGNPQLDLGIILTSLITSLLVITNLIASIQVVEKVVERPPQPVYNKSGFVLGINQLIAGVFSAVPSIALTLTAGFIQTTKNKKKLPFTIGASILVGISIFPAITLLFATIPPPVAYATFFLAFANMLGIGLKEYRTIQMDEKNLFIIGISIMVGSGSMFIPVESIRLLPQFLIPIINNGLIIGVIVCIALEQFLRLTNKPKIEKIHFRKGLTSLKK